MLGSRLVITLSDSRDNRRSKTNKKEKGMESQISIQERLEVLKKERMDAMWEAHRKAYKKYIRRKMELRKEEAENETLRIDSRI